jgi:hypothetical protein
MTFLMTSSRIASSIVLCFTLGECWVDRTTASMRGAVVSYSTVTWVLPSGRSQSTFFFLRTSASFARQLVRVADRRGHQLGRLVGRVAEHQALVAGALLLVRPSPSVTPCAMSGDCCSMAVRTAQVLSSKPMSESV